MAQQCELCGKKPASGHNVSHSNRKTKRRFMPNLQKIRVSVQGLTQRVKMCTSCLKTYAVKLAS